MTQRTGSRNASWKSPATIALYNIARLVLLRDKLLEFESGKLTGTKGVAGNKAYAYTRYKFRQEIHQMANIIVKQDNWVEMVQAASQNADYLKVVIRPLERSAIKYELLKRLSVFGMVITFLPNPDLSLLFYLGATAAKNRSDKFVEMAGICKEIASLELHEAQKLIDRVKFDARTIPLLPRE